MSALCVMNQELKVRINKEDREIHRIRRAYDENFVRLMASVNMTPKERQPFVREEIRLYKAHVERQKELGVYIEINDRDR